MQKIQGEVFEIQGIRDILNGQAQLSADLINDKYRRGEIRIITEQARYPIDSITTMLDSKKYKLNPEYQRRKRWDNLRKSRLIESFIMNVPIPPIFLYEVNYSEYEVMDGLQRLTTIYDFYDGQFRLEGLLYWKELNGMTYNELPSEVQKGIDRRYLSSIVLLQETAKNRTEAESLKQIVFERLNSGGEKLEPQEIRNALYNGSFNQKCITLAENKHFKEMWNIVDFNQQPKQASESYRKMEDVELVLRFFAYRFIDKLSGYTVEKFLDEYLKEANKFNNTTIQQLEKLFSETIETVFTIFGKKAFVLPKIKRETSKPTKTVYDPLMQSVAIFILDGKKDLLIQNATILSSAKFADESKIINSEGKALFDGRYNSNIEVSKRILYFNDLINSNI
ncbi:DUF262 domain-containing protein [Sulfurospirillum diekertiae]|uniref:DUF262 domain-containing protein n=1 Tax=Sulfurospirillum diekertiae TaxID=1854492 RepID=A0AA92FE66_9BACT|nr:DUF262 domain-containing protein [Sulfurospirillum diekertiae]QIR74747.1 DUF262 domain-containing protein [Sulfurospirillum diekertiae]